MTTTVRLLATYDGNPPQTIVRLPDALAASFVAAGNASLNLTGGINVPPPAITHVVGGGARLIYSAAGALLGIGDSNGNLILNSSGATTPVGATVPGAPTGLALTAAAGAVIGAFTAPASTGGDPIQWYELTLSNGTVVRGDASPIAAAAPAGSAVTAVVRAVNGVGPSVASNTSNSVTPTGAAVATALTLTGPTAVAQNVATTNYTVALSPNGGTVATPVTVTPTPVAGVTFAPTSLTLTTASPSGTFTATATTTGTKSIVVTNDGGLTNPGAISLVVSAASVPATALTLTGPTAVVQGVASTNYTVALAPNGGTVASPVTVTPTAVAGVTFAPTSLTLSTGSPSGTFTATSSTTGTKSIAVTNNGGLTNPAAINLVVSAAGQQFVDVVFFAGQSQSNSNGTSGTGTDVPVSLQGPMADVFTWDPFNKVWLTYEAGVNSSVHLEGGKYAQPGAKYHGMEAEYMRRWKESNPGVPIYMIKKGHSTTSLSTLARTANRGCWDPSLTGANSDLFEELVAWTADACANIRAAGKTPRFRGFNWIQGENDADNLTATNQYQANLTAFIGAVRTRLDSAATNIPFIISRIQVAQWQNAAALRTAQEATAAAVANTRWFDADGATLAADAVHYNPAGCLFLGRICYDAGMSAAEITARYISRMTAAPSAGRQTALNTLFASLVDKSVWPTVAALQLYASHDQQSALVSAGYANLVGIPTNETFVVDRGATGSGTGSHIDTNFNPSTTDGRYRAGGNSQSVWIRTKPDNNGIDIGAFTNGVVVLGVSVPSTSIRVTASSDVNNIVSTVAKTTGLTTVQRLGATDSRLYQDGAQLGSPATSPTGTLPTSNLWVGDRSGGTSSPTIAQYSAFLCGAPRTAQQEADLYAALNSYLTGIGAV